MRVKKKQKKTTCPAQQSYCLYAKIKMQKKKKPVGNVEPKNNDMC